MSEWTKVRIGDLCKTNTKSYSPKEGWTFVNYLDTGNITKNVVDEVQYIDLSKEKLPSRAKRKVQHNSVLFSTVRPNQLHYGIIKSQPENFLVSTGFAVMDADAERLDPDYLYYLLSSNEIVEGLHAIAEQSTSAYPSIKPSDIENLEVDVPDIETQKKISAVLVSIDEKIRSNTAINKNLLQQALCLYSSLIGESAKNGCIGDYCSIKSGFAFKSKWWQDSGVPVVKIGSINQDYLNLSDCSYVSDDKITYANDFIVFGGDLLIAMTGATIGKFTMVPKVSETILVNQRVGKFFLGEKPVAKLPFIYCTLKQPDIISELINRGQGSAQPNISATDIMTIPCVIPNTDEIDKFNRELSPMFEMIINNQYGNTMLSNTRDVILPKLMSGELDVSALDI